MEAGRQKALNSKMTGCVNLDNNMTDTYLPRKCDFTDRILTSKDHSSIQLSVCDVPLHPLRSMPTAPSTTPRATSSPSQDSSAPPARATPLSKKSSGKRNSSDSWIISFISISPSTNLPAQLARVVAQKVVHALLGRHHCIAELGLIVDLLVACLLC